MLLLTTTTESIEMKTGSASGIDWTASWVDMTTTAFTPGSGDGSVASASDNNTIVAAPAASTQRQVKFLSFRNVGASNNTVQVQKDNNATNRVLYIATLQPGEALYYLDGQGFMAVDTTGAMKVVPAGFAPVPTLECSPIFATADITTAKTITSTNTFALYMGKAPRKLTSVQMRCRVTTAGATITWAEVALAKGAPVLAGNPTLTCVGHTDVSATFNSTGLKSTTINVASGQVLEAGDDVWLLIGCQATTAVQVRAQSIVDDLTAGFQASAVMRPSLNIGSGVSFTLEGAVVAAWLNIFY